MNRIRIFILATPLIVVACSSINNKGTIAELSHTHIEIKEENIEGGLEKAMLSYERFLEETPDSDLKPEAIRRLADLKIEKAYGTFTTPVGSAGHSPALPMLERATHPDAVLVPTTLPDYQIQIYDESEANFEKRTTGRQPVDNLTEADRPFQGVDDLERSGTREAIALYSKLLNDYPMYERNDEVLYQMSRAHEELGQIEEAMSVMDRMVRDYPRSRYIDEVQFRRAEYFFMHKRYMDAEIPYKSIVDIGAGSSFYELALYKLGWTFYKQELYEDALHRFIALMDYKVSIGYDFAQTEDEQERKRTEDTFRVISLSFSNLGGAASVVDYFSSRGKRSYENRVYSNLGEFYLDKRRYADASAAFSAFVDHNPFHMAAPNFHMKVIEIQAAGGFPSLVLDSKKNFATTYSLNAKYWQYFDPADRPDVLGLLKTNLTDLANHYHAGYQNPEQNEKKQTNFEEARKWYREFLLSFPLEDESPFINYQLADLLLENRAFGAAAVEFERTAYDYPSHKKSAKAAYAAVSAYREQLSGVELEDEGAVKREVIRSSLKFAETFPDHDKAAIVLGAAADDLYGMKEYEQALAAAGRLIEVFPGADTDVVRDAWLVIGHSSYELLHYSEAESAYLNVLGLLSEEHELRNELLENLAASIYKQGEQANAAEDYQDAADHFLRVGRMAKDSKIRPNAEYDAAAALIQLKDWERAASVLYGFRSSFPDNPLQPEVTKKIAYVYREDGRLALAAEEYERIERESKDDEIRRDALQVAAELYEQDGDSTNALKVYRRYVDYFPQPVELNLETRNNITVILKARDDMQSYLDELREIVAVDTAAGVNRTPRTRYLAANAALVLAEKKFYTFTAVALTNPLEANLKKKRELMKESSQDFNRLIEYEIGETTAAAMFYIAEIYSHFSEALMASERPQGLSPLELEQYELAIEDQAYPFQEQSITYHEDNLKLIALGVYNVWVDKSLQKLSEVIPVRYDKPEETSGIISSLNTYVYEIVRSKPPAPAEPETESPALAGQTGPAAENETTGPVQDEEYDPVMEQKTEAPAQSEQTGPAIENAVQEQDEQREHVMEQDNVSPALGGQTPTATEPGAVELEPADDPEPVKKSESGESASANYTGLKNTVQAIRR
jgi:tetratricopeptide (TPR) repeat protein